MCIRDRSSSLLSAPTAGFAGPVLRANFSKDTTILASSHEPLAGRYSTLPKKTFPSVAERKAGAGHVIYLAGGLGATYAQYGVADYKKLLPMLISRLIAPTITVSNLYETIEVNVREQEGRTLVHFVNYTGAMRRPLEDVIPCEGIKITLCVSHPVRHVSSMRTGSEIPFVFEDGKVSFSFDLPGVYDVAVIS